jgi:anaerobic magnesium-protoporphyrin IX monomethyl ester cyclase
MGKLLARYLDLYREPGSVFLLAPTFSLHDKLIGQPGDHRLVLDSIHRNTPLVKIVILKENYQLLPELITFIRSAGGERVQLLYPEPLRGYEEEYAQLVPDVADAVPWITEARSMLEGLALVPNTYPFRYEKPDDLETDSSDVRPLWESRPWTASMTTSIIVLSADRREHLLRVLDALDRQSVSDFEVIIVDDNSRDGTAEMVRARTYQFRLVYVRWPRSIPFEPGKPRNRAGPCRNLGTRHAKGSLLIFIDGDIVVNQEFVRAHRSLAAENVVVIGPSLGERDGKDLRDIIFALCDDDLSKTPITWALAHSGNFSVHKHVFDALGGFSDEFVYWGMEDDEFGYRLWKAGCTFRLCRDAWGLHLDHPPEFITPGILRYGEHYHTELFYKKYLDSAIYYYYIDRTSRRFQKTGYLTITFGTGCNNNCSCCAFLGEKRAHKSRREIADVITSARISGTRLVLTGGEPLLSKDFWNVLSQIATAGVKEVELVTNGRAISYERIADRLMAVGVTHYLILMYGDTAEIHDAATGVSGSFIQTLKGIKNLRERGALVAVHLVISGANHTRYESMKRMLNGLGVTQFQLTVIPPAEGGGWSEAEFIAFVERILRENRPDVRLRNEFFTCIERQQRGRLIHTDMIDFKRCLYCCFALACHGDPMRLTQNASRRVYVRDDDVRTRSPRLLRLINLCVQESVPLSLAVVPGSVTDDCVDYLKTAQAQHPELFEIHQHGWMHAEHQTAGEEPYEFGPSRTEDAQRADIVSGITRLGRLFDGKTVPLFTPPYDGFDQNTVRILKEQGFKAISLNEESQRSTPAMRHLPFALDPVKNYHPLEFHGSEHIMRRFSLLCHDRPSFGIVLHHETLGDAEFDFLESFFKHHKAAGVRFVLASDLLKPRILLLNPPFANKTAPLGEPTGLLSLGGSLEEQGYEVKIVDFTITRYSPEYLASVLHDFQPGYVGLTAVVTQAENAYRIGQAVREHYEGAKIIMGGVHATFLPEEALTRSSADVVVVGEGEETLTDLICAWEQGRDISSVLGIAYLHEGSLKLTGERPFIDHLDELPLPSYPLVPLGLYQTSECMVPGAQHKAVHVLTSRGCPNSCSYCASPKLYKRRVRWRSIDNVMKELRLLKAMDISWVHFHDDNFLLDPARVRLLCRRLRSEGLGVSWTCLANVATVAAHPDILNEMKESGCLAVEIGVESGDEKVLRILKGSQDLSLIRNAVRYLREAQITAGFLMMGYTIGETLETPYLSLRFLYELMFGALESDIIPPLDTSMLTLWGHTARASPGSEFYLQAPHHGRVLAQSWDDHSEDNLSFIPYSLLSDVPRKIRPMDQSEALRYITDQERTIRFCSESNYYLTALTLEQHFHGLDDCYRLMADIYVRCEGKTVAELVEEFDHRSIQAVVSCLTMLSIIRLIGSRDHSDDR